MNKKIRNLIISVSVLSLGTVGCSFEKVEVDPVSNESMNVVSDAVKESIDNIESVANEVVDEKNNAEIEDLSSKIYNELVSLGEVTEENVNYVVNKYFVEYVSSEDVVVDATNIEETIPYWNEVLSNLGEKVSNLDLGQYVPDDMGEYFTSGNAWEDYLGLVDSVNEKALEVSPVIIDGASDLGDKASELYDEYSPSVKEKLGEGMDAVSEFNDNLTDKAKTYIKEKEENNN